jgi:hypothetical protein
MKKNNLLYLLAGGVAVYLVVRAMRKKDDDGEANFMYATGKRKAGDPCGCFGTKGSRSRGVAVNSLSDGTVVCENSYGYTYGCSQTGLRSF